MTYNAPFNGGLGNSHMYHIDDIQSELPPKTYRTVDMMYSGMLNLSGLSKFNQIIHKSGMYYILNQPQADFTLFAPRNEALINIDIAKLDSGDCRRIVNSSLINGKISSAVLKSTVSALYNNNDQYTNLTVTNDGTDLFVKLNDPSKYNSKIIIPDIQFKNGIIHVIDTAIIPTPLF